MVSLVSSRLDWRIGSNLCPGCWLFSRRFSLGSPFFSTSNVVIVVTVAGGVS